MRLSPFQKKSILLYQRLSELQLFDHGDKSNFRFIDRDNRKNNSENVPIRTLDSWRTTDLKTDKRGAHALKTLRDILTKQFGVQASEAFIDDTVGIDVFCDAIKFHRI